MSMADSVNINFDPVFTKEQVLKAGEEYNATWGVKSRIMMAVLSKSGQNLVDTLTSMLAEDETGEEYFEMIRCIEDYEEHLKAGIELAQSAIARLLTVAQYVAGDDESSSE